jgi:hypothetical protein
MILLRNVLTMLLVTACAAQRADSFLASNRATVVDGELSLHCQPAAAQVKMDGVPMGTCADFAGQRQVIHAGRKARRIEVSMPGHASWTNTVEAERTRVTLEVQLPKIAEGGR